MNKSYEHLTRVKAAGGTVRVFMGQWMTASVEHLDLPLSGESLTVKLHIHGEPKDLSMVKNAFIRSMLFSSNASQFHLLERSDWKLTDIHDNFMIAPNTERWGISLTLFEEGTHEQLHDTTDC